MAHANLLRDLERRGQMSANHIAVHCRAWMRAGRTAEIRSALRQALATFPDAAHVILQGREGRVLNDSQA